MYKPKYLYKMKEKQRKRKTGIKRLIPSQPIESRYLSVCSVCKKEIAKNELISPYLDGDKNLWRHQDCLQLFFLEQFLYEGSCEDCGETINVGIAGYWSKHNGVWCENCGEKLFPDTHVAYSRHQKENKILKKLKA